MENLREILENRFNEHMSRHEGLVFGDLWEKVTSDNSLYQILINMEETGGCPDFVKIDDKILVFDSYEKIPEARKSLCYDRQALEKRKNNKPKSDVLTEVNKIGSSLVGEDLYYKIQDVFKFDEKISSWVKPPDDLRKRGGAIFCDRRYDRVFTYHNGAESYYSSRGYRTYFVLD